jgi:hypothetical protein
VMQLLRAPSHGGVGRLEQTRLDLVTGSGELVPVNMTASILYENGREAATVGILSDLRERLLMEERLLHVQEQLEQQERQAMVAQLAGAAAHELNQPLTSILGYAQLIERQSDADAPHLRALQVILREATRMADIVRKIGRITRYETKEYVGSASIIDLDKSAESSQNFGVSPSSDAADADLLESSDPTDTESEPPTRVGKLPRSTMVPDGTGGVVEPAEEEITAQHLIVARPARAETGPVLELSGMDDDERDRTGEYKPGETAERPVDRIAKTSEPTG